MSSDKNKQNMRLALILGTVAVVFFLGFMARVLMLTHA